MSDETREKGKFLFVGRYQAKKRKALSYCYILLEPGENNGSRIRNVNQRIGIMSKRLTYSQVPAGSVIEFDYDPADSEAGYDSIYIHSDRGRRAERLKNEAQRIELQAGDRAVALAKDLDRDRDKTLKKYGLETLLKKLEWAASHMSAKERRAFIAYLIERML